MTFNPRSLNKFLFTLCFIWFSSSASAAKIMYDVIDLSDTTAGEDLWQYSYTVSDYTFNVDNGFSIFFDQQSYSNLESPPPAVNLDWDAVTFQPDNALPDDGIYDAISLSNGASLASPFTVNFVWTGNGLPGVQPFDLYDESFNTVASGFTSPVPEPAPMLLMLMATSLMGLFAYRRNRLSSGNAMGENS